MSSKADMTARIREGTIRRQQESRRRQQLQSELLESRRAEQDEADKNGAIKYLPNIIIFLLFVSFPLSERIVDWDIVGFFCALNALWLVVTRFLTSSWILIAFIVLSNFLLVRLSHELYEVPAMVAAIPPTTFAVYIGCNAVVMVLLYAFYVDPDLELVRGRGLRVPVARDRLPEKYNKHRDGLRDDGALEEYARQRERLERTDIALSIILVANVVAAICIGWIPLESVLRSVSGLLRVLK